MHWGGVGDRESSSPGLNLAMLQNRSPLGMGSWQLGRISGENVEEDTHSKGGWLGHVKPGA